MIIQNGPVEPRPGATAARLRPHTMASSSDDAVAAQCAHVLAQASASHGSDGSAARARAAELLHEVRRERERAMRARGRAREDASAHAFASTPRDSVRRNATRAWVC